MSDLVKVLQRAKQIVQDGWYQGGHTDGQGNFCARAAVGLASECMDVTDKGELDFRGIDYATASTFELGLHARNMKLDQAAIRLLTENLPSPHNCLPLFNDAHNTTLNDVVQVFDKAITSC
jgi:hypothetical protein